MPWTPQQEEPEEESQEAKTRTLQRCAEDTYHEEDSCNEDAEGDDRKIYVKLSATPVTERDILVAIALSIRGIINETTNKVGRHDQAKGERR